MSDNTLSCEVKNSPDFGRFITAATHFSFGDVILDEAPLIVVPSTPFEIDFQNVLDNVTVTTAIKTCVGCCKVFSSELTLSCVQCKWPICSRQCEQESFHARYECNLFKNKQIPPMKSSFEFMNLIRASLMFMDRNHSSDWEHFTSLSSKIDIQTNELKALIKKDIRQATKFINDVCGLNIDKRTIRKIRQTFTTNAFSLCGKDENSSSYDASLLYKMGCLFSHSCAPNAEWIILPTTQNGISRFHLRIYAKRNIRRNEPITIAYTQDCLTSDTASRQKFIQLHCHFYCQCQRCVDPKEFNYYTSSLRCTVCEDVTLTADIPSDEFSTWTCTVCQTCKDSLVMKSYIDDYENALEAVMKNSDSRAERESSLEILINSLDKRNLTTNHRAATRTIYYWLKCQIFKDLLEFSMESQIKFIKIMQRATQCLKMFRMFAPLDCVVCVELVFAYTIASFYFKNKTLCTIGYDNYNLVEKQQVITAIYGHMKIAVQIMQTNPYSTLYCPFRERTLTQFKFWDNEVLKFVQPERMEDVDHGIPSNEAHFDGAMIANEQIKSSPCPLSDEQSKDCESQSSSVLPSVGVQSSRVSETVVVKPDVALLSQLDFYFTN